MENPSGGGLEAIYDQINQLTIRPSLGNADDFDMSSEQVRSIFGIEDKTFTPIPKTIFVPVLDSHHQADSWYHVHGWMYVLEPQEWVPVVRHGSTVTAAELNSDLLEQRKFVSEAKFNADCKATISFTSGPSGSQAIISVNGNDWIEFPIARKTTLTDADIKTKDIPRDGLVQELVLYPILRCRASKRQRINMAINDSTDELKWSGDKSSSFEPGYWDRIRLPLSQVDRLMDTNVKIDPAPLHGHSPENSSVCFLPAVRRTGISGAHDEYATIISRTGWKDWFEYTGAEFKEYYKIVDLAASQNDVAFGPARSWTMLLDERPGQHESCVESGEHREKGQSKGSLDAEVDKCAMEPLD